MNPIKEFEASRKAGIAALGRDHRLKSLTREWFNASCRRRYSYHFNWLGRPIIQFPQDIVALQEIVFETKPELIVETGVAHGGSLIFYASMLQLLGKGSVVGIDVDIRPHNRREIESHFLSRRVKLIEGSSTDERVAEKVRRLAKGKRVMVVLDSNHEHDHVLRELELYSPLVKKGGYLIVCDTVVDDMPKTLFPDRPWGPGNNPKTAVRRFLKTNKRFVLDRSIEDKLMITVAPEGYLRCTAD